MKKVARNQLEDILKIVCFDIYVSNSRKMHVKSSFFSAVATFKPATILKKTLIKVLVKDLTTNLPGHT